MIEQCVYSRASNEHVNANGQRINIGYGRVAYSQDYDALSDNLDKTIKGYPCLMTDSRGVYPGIMTKYETDTRLGPAQVIQKVTRLQADGERPYHIGHQYVAVGEKSVRDFLQNPIAWMQLSFLEQFREPMSGSVVQNEKLQLARNFVLPPLTNVLAYFSIALDEFEYLLCTLFDTMAYNDLFTLVLVDDTRPDYADWIQRLIVHINMFLPYAMRRKIGFESWISGQVDSRMCKLYFSGYRNLVKSANRYKLRIGQDQLIDVTHCFVFYGSRLLHVKDPSKEEHFAKNTSYRRFVHAWLIAASNVQQCIYIEQTLNGFWERFDRTPDGGNAVAPDKFENIQAYQSIMQGEFSLSWRQMMAFANSFIKGMGPLGDEALKKLIESIPYKGEEAVASTVLCELIDGRTYGPETSQAAIDQLTHGADHLTVKQSRLMDVLTVIFSAQPENTKVLLRYLEDAEQDLENWDRLISYLAIAAKIEFREPIREKAFELFRGSLPETLKDVDYIRKIRHLLNGFPTKEMDTIVAECVCRADMEVVSIMDLLDFCVQNPSGPLVCESILRLANQSACQGVNDVVRFINYVLRVLPSEAEDIAYMAIQNVRLTCEDEAEAFLRDIDGLGEGCPARIYEAAAAHVLFRQNFSVSFRLKTARDPILRYSIDNAILCRFLDDILAENKWRKEDLSQTVSFFAEELIDNALREKLVRVLLSIVEYLDMDCACMRFLSSIISRLPESIQPMLFGRVLSRLDKQNVTEDGFLSELWSAISLFPMQVEYGQALSHILKSFLSVVGLYTKDKELFRRFLERQWGQNDEIAQRLLLAMIETVHLEGLSSEEGLNFLLTIYEENRLHEEARDLVLKRMLAHVKSSVFPVDALSALSKAVANVIDGAGFLIEAIFASAEVDQWNVPSYLFTCIEQINKGYLSESSLEPIYRIVTLHPGAISIEIICLKAILEIIRREARPEGRDVFAALIRAAKSSSDGLSSDLRALLTLCRDRESGVAQSACEKAMEIIESNRISIKHIRELTEDMSLPRDVQHEEILSVLLRNVQAESVQEAEACIMNLADYVLPNQGAVISRAAVDAIVGLLEQWPMHDVLAFSQKAKHANLVDFDRLLAKALAALNTDGDSTNILNSLSQLYEKRLVSHETPAAHEKLEMVVSQIASTFTPRQLCEHISSMMPDFRHIFRKQLADLLTELPKEAPLAAMRLNDNIKVRYDDILLDFFFETDDLLMDYPELREMGSGALLSRIDGHYAGDPVVCSQKLTLRASVLPQSLVEEARKTLIRIFSNGDKSKMKSVEFKVAFDEEFAAIDNAFRDSDTAVKVAFLDYCTRHYLFTDDMIENLCQIYLDRRGTECSEASFRGLCSITFPKFGFQSPTYQQYMKCTCNIAGDELRYRIITQYLSQRERGVFKQFLDDIWNQFRMANSSKNIDANLILGVFQWCLAFAGVEVYRDDDEYKKVLLNKLVHVMKKTLSNAKEFFEFLRVFEKQEKLFVASFESLIEDLLDYIKRIGRQNEICEGSLFDSYLKESIHRLDELGPMDSIYSKYLAFRFQYIASILMDVLFYNKQAMDEEWFKFSSTSDCSKVLIGWKGLFHRVSSLSILKKAEADGYDLLCSAFCDYVEKIFMRKPDNYFWIQMPEKLPYAFLQGSSALVDKLCVSIISAVIDENQIVKKEKIVAQINDSNISQTQIDESYAQADLKARKLLARFFQMPSSPQDKKNKPYSNFLSIMPWKRIDYLICCQDLENMKVTLKGMLRNKQWDILAVFSQAVSDAIRYRNITPEQHDALAVELYPLILEWIPDGQALLDRLYKDKQITKKIDRRIREFMENNQNALKIYCGTVHRNIK